MRYLVNNHNFDDEISDKKWDYLLKVYYKHLLRLRLSNKSPVLKYFGADFFHDAILKKAILDYNNKLLKIHIVREETDFCDMNEFRKDYGLKKIKLSEYRKNPIIYEFLFSGVSEFITSANYKYIPTFLIINSEIDYKKKSLLLTIEQDKETYLKISFSKCSFKIINKKYIKKYTNGNRISFPYCSHCKDNLLNRLKIIQFLKK